MWIEHPLIREKAMEYREYQIKIAERCLKGNTLVVLPTGLGKTNIALLAICTLFAKNKDCKVLFLAPTKPLVAQHKKTFEKITKIPGEFMALVTGEQNKYKRIGLYKYKLIFATPQTVKNDLKEGILNLEDFCMVVFDEAHKAVGNYAYVYIAKKYLEQAKKPLILGLTASPSYKKEKIEEIKRNLSVHNIEIRTERDKDVRPYVKEKQIEWIRVELTDEFKKVQELLKDMIKKEIDDLFSLGVINKLDLSRKELLDLQKFLSEQSRENPSPALFFAISKVAKILKLDHALTLLETQGITPLKFYLRELLKSKTKAEEQLIKDERFRTLIKIVENSKEEHPKLTELKKIVEKEIQEGKNVIVFAQYRKTVEKIVKSLENDIVKPIALLGKKEGITQRKQLEVIEKFSSGEKNCLVCTSVGEEGLDIKSADVVVFYEPVPSEIRQIQRRGRVARMKAGKIIILITKGTRDEGYYWSAFHKEKKMKKYLDREKKIKKESLIGYL